MTEPIAADNQGRIFVIDECELVFGNPRYGKNAAFYREFRKALATDRRISFADPKAPGMFGWGSDE